MNRKKKLVIPRYRNQLVRESKSVFHLPQDSLNKPATAAAMFRKLLGKPDREMFCALALDAKLSPFGFYVVSIGTLNSSLVHPREVFKDAISLGAYALLVCHNHPSGSLEPSDEDRTITRRLIEAGEILGVPLFDHIILGDGRAYTAMRSEALGWRT